MDRLLHIALPTQLNTLKCTMSSVMKHIHPTPDRKCRVLVFERAQLTRSRTDAKQDGELLIAQDRRRRKKMARDCLELLRCNPRPWPPVSLTAARRYPMVGCLHHWESALAGKHRSGTSHTIWHARRKCQGASCKSCADNQYGENEL